VKRDPLIIVILAMVISLMLVFGFHRARNARDGVTASANARLQQGPAPDFALQSLEGQTMKLSDFRGKAVLLNFWATWCAPCKIEMPWFVELQKQYASQGLQIIGVAMDDASTKDIADFAKEMGVNYPVLLGKEAVGEAYGGVQFLPENFYIDRSGKIVDRAFGLKGRAEIEDEIKKIVASTVVAQKKP
jgi:thiol-disulfide isomerase/thioredoxin